MATKKVYFKTFGCRTNLYDSQVMMSSMQDFEVTEDEAEADTIVIIVTEPYNIFRVYKKIMKALTKLVKML